MTTNAKNETKATHEEHHVEDIDSGVIGKITVDLVAAVIGIDDGIKVELTADTSFSTDILFANMCCCGSGNDYYILHALNSSQTYLLLPQFLLSIW